MINGLSLAAVLIENNEPSWYSFHNFMTVRSNSLYVHMTVLCVHCTFHEGVERDGTFPNQLRRPYGQL